MEVLGLGTCASDHARMTRSFLRPTTLLSISFLLGLPLACNDDAPAETGNTTDTSGDGDGDGDPGDGDGDEKPIPPPCPHTPVDNPTGIATELIIDNIGEPVLALGHPTKPDELYIVERNGEVLVVDMNTGTEQAEPFLSVDVTTFVEYGLLGFAFHPYYPDDPRVYINYSPLGEDMTRISEFTVDLDANVAMPASERVVLELHQPAPNHNGGMIAFGPDDYLYIGMGDGGGADDTFDTGRDFEVLLAKILRIDVEPTGVADKDPISCPNCPQYGPFDYGIPADNPFVADPNVADEIWALGFRNPWRFTFDIETGELYVGDVGQDIFEEIDIVTGGADYGWSDMEGFSCFQNAPCMEGMPSVANQVNGDGLTFPIHDYDHGDNNCSVTGGNVYRSCEAPSWSGTYFFGDYCNGRVDALIWDGVTATLPDPDGDILETPVFSNVLGFGGNAWGDVFICTANGDVFRIVPA
jgi:glucose/arabinose dehydrogenase